VGQRIKEDEVRLLEADAQRVTVDGLQAGDLALVVELVVLARRLDVFVQPLDVALEEEGPGRAVLRVDEALERVDVVVRRQRDPA
jgi:hypothetical protein